VRHRLHHEPVHRPARLPDNPATQDAVKIGILLGSFVAAAAGSLVLLTAPAPGPEPEEVE
jgi:hypothetical protein